MTIKLNYKKLVEYLVNDEEQRELLKILAEKRGMELKTLLRRGIFGVPDKDELGYLLEQWGLSFEDVFGKDEVSVKLVNEGFIIPVLDSSYNVIFYVNYNWERGSARKYINVYPDGFDTSKMKMFGTHNLAKGVKEDWIVVVEGMFDEIRLEEYGIPSVAIMGNKVTDYHVQFLSRFSTVIYISDADEQGFYGWQKVKNRVDTAIHYPIKSLSKDVDSFAQDDPMNFKEWLDGLKAYRPMKQGK